MYTSTVAHYWPGCCYYYYYYYYYYCTNPACDGISQRTQHDNNVTAVFPQHPPEVLGRVGEWSLSRYVRPPYAVTLCDRQTDRQTDRITHTYTLTQTDNWFNFNSSTEMSSLCTYLRSTSISREQFRQPSLRHPLRTFCFKSVLYLLTYLLASQNKLIWVEMQCVNVHQWSWRWCSQSLQCHVLAADTRDLTQLHAHTETKPSNHHLRSMLLTNNTIKLQRVTDTIHVIHTATLLHMTIVKQNWTLDYSKTTNIIAPAGYIHCFTKEWHRLASNSTIKTTSVAELMRVMLNLQGRTLACRFLYLLLGRLALTKCSARQRFVVINRCNTVTLMYRVVQKTGPAYLIANILKTLWPNCVEIGGLLQYYMLNTVINFFFV